MAGDIGDIEQGPLLQNEAQIPRLDLSQYGQWRDYLYKLQTEATKIPNILNSSLLGSWARSIGQQTVLGLAERSASIQTKYKGIATIDKVPDEKVMIEATPEDRIIFF